MSSPKDLRYTPDHEWARIEGREAVIGITHHAQEQLGDIVFTELPSEGDDVMRGERFGSVESTKAVSDCLAPLTGKVLAVNAALSDAPQTINSDPYGEGWMIRIELSNPAEADEMLDADAYDKLVAESH